MIEEYDIVKAVKSLSEKVSINDTGTVLLVFEGELKSYEVEFMDDDGNTLDTLTVKEEDIQKIE